ncbi:TetR/AcrR family transcriptional regulator [Maricaulis sp. D1M11]|uniref:TetR/AcrR family transcriptional regulator n=1 Tax=Maricaulis sp. D1M11 TaxID=3076117 RepID=UPI0039B69C3F
MSSKSEPRRDKARTRQGILDAAWDLVRVQGAEVSMADIARAAGVSRQLVYLNFTSRGGLLMELVRRADERFAIKAAFDEAARTGDAQARLAGCLRAWFRFVREIDPVARDLVRLRDTDADAAAAWEDRMSDLRSWWLALLLDLEREGALVPGWTAARAADHVWASSSVQVWGLYVRDCGWSEAETEAHLLTGICQLVLAGDWCGR